MTFQSLFQSSSIPCYFFDHLSLHTFLIISPSDWMKTNSHGRDCQWKWKESDSSKSWIFWHQPPNGWCPRHCLNLLHCMPCLWDPSNWGPFSSGFHREGVWRRQEQALGRRLQDQNWLFVTMSRWENCQTPNFCQRHIGGLLKTICDIIVSQAAGSCSITTASLLNCVSSVLYGCRVQARLMGYEGAWRGRWFGGVWGVWRVSVVRWRSWWRCPGHLHSSCKSPVWRLFSSFIYGCSLAFQIQLKCGCDAMLDLSPSSHEISQSPYIPYVLACRLHVTCIFCLTDPGIYTALVAHDRFQEWFRGADIATLRYPPPCWWGWTNGASSVCSVASWAYLVRI